MGKPEPPWTHMNEPLATNYSTNYYCCDHVPKISHKIMYIYFIIIGVINSYIQQQILYCILFFSTAVFWATVFPFSYKEAKSNGNLKYFKISSLILILILPLSSLLYLVDGLYSGSLILSYCTSKDPLYFFFIITVPISFILWIVSVLLVFVAWTIFKVSVLYSTVVTT